MKLLRILSLASAIAAAPTAETCTSKSQTAQFTIKSFKFDSLATYSSPSHPATSQGTVSFDFGVSPKNAVIKCSASTVGTYPTYFDGSTFYDCKNTDSLSASFKYNLHTGVVTVKAHWNCPDSSWNAGGKANTIAYGSCDTSTKKNNDWSVQHPGPYYEQISTSCFDAETTFKPSKISGVA